MTKPLRTYPPKDKRKKAPQKVGNILSLALRSAGIDREIARYEFVIHWQEIMGPAISSRTRPDSFKNGILTLRVSNPQWAQELVFHKELLMNRLNKFLSEGSTKEIVRDIRFCIGDLRS